MPYQTQSFAPSALLWALALLATPVTGMAETVPTTSTSAPVIEGQSAGFEARSYRYRLTRESVLAGPESEDEVFNGADRSGILFGVDLLLPRNRIAEGATVAADNVLVPAPAVDVWAETQRILAYLAARYGEVEVVTGADRPFQWQRLVGEDWRPNTPDRLYHAVYLPRQGVGFAMLVPANSGPLEQWWDLGMLTLADLEKETGEAFFEEFQLRKDVKASRFVSRSTRMAVSETE